MSASCQHEAIFAWRRSCPPARAPATVRVRSAAGRVLLSPAPSLPLAHLCSSSHACSGMSGAAAAAATVGGRRCGGDSKEKRRGARGGPAAMTRRGPKAPHTIAPTHIEHARWVSASLMLTLGHQVE